VRPPAEMAQRFRDLGLKVTPQRELIFELLWGATGGSAGARPEAGHPTADAVYAEARRRMPTMSLRTVYQTLNDLATMGEIHQLDLGTGSSRFDPNTDVHHHLVCTRCGKIRDLYADFTSVRVPPDAGHGFRVGAAEVVFRGLCEDCQASRPAPVPNHRS
jgi:Fur family peroxide stress response transcriptional regulator